MKTSHSSNHRNLSDLALAWFLTLAAAGSVQAQSSAFTYQGNLSAGSAAAQGNYELRFTLHDASSGGATVAGPLTNAGVAVSNGYFATTLDFGATAFDGAARWLEIGVRTNGSVAAFATLAPRQPVTATPYAVRAANFGGSVADGQLSANVARLNANQTFSGAVQLTNAGNTLNGGGAGLTALNASQLASGTLPDARLSTDVARRTGGNTLTGNQTFTNGIVGIGMAPDSFPLSIKGNSGVSSDYLRLRDSDGTNRWHLSGQGNGLNFVESGVADYRLFLAPGGNVGLGTNNPVSKLHIAGTVTASGYSGDGTGLSGLARLGASQAFTGVNTFSNTVRISDSDVLEFGAGLVKEINAGKIGYGAFTPNTLDIVGGGGNVASRSVKIHAEGGTTFTGPISAPTFSGGLNLPKAFAPDSNFVGTPGNYISFAHEGVSEDFIGYKNNTFYFKDSLGGADTAQPNVVVGGNVEAAMLILNGGADLSEGFGLTDEAQPGMVVCIDPENPGKVKTSQRAYDRTVAGIISGAGGVNTGMMMSQKGSVAHGDHPVALTGRVYCWADASAGAIEPGDLLTSAEVPGHAMKVTDHARAPGAVLGKAMTGLKEGKGLVLVLVSLQ